jgi:DinB superfamily
MRRRRELAIPLDVKARMPAQKTTVAPEGRKTGRCQPSAAAVLLTAHTVYDQFNKRTGGSLMDEIAVIRDNHLKLRDDIAAWVHDHLSGAAWFFQPTPLSNPAAWIVPHLIAFEQQFVYDQISGYPFPRGVSPHVVERYKPGVDGFSMGEANLMSAEEALAGLARLREITDRFLSEIQSGGAGQGAVDRQQVLELYQHNFSHDTEHFGQLKYLSGTWSRLHV